MRFPFAFLGLLTQAPLQQPPLQSKSAMVQPVSGEFSFKEGADVFAPKDLVSRGVVLRP
jgi:hypothetical protein